MALSYESMLAKTDLFTGLSNEELGRFAGRVQLNGYNAGQVITKQGDLGTGLFVIVSGAVDVIHNRGEADEANLATLGQGDFFGDLALLLERPRGASVVAREQTECFTLVRWDFKELSLESPQLLWQMLVSVAERLAEADSAVEQSL